MIVSVALACVLLYQGPTAVQYVKAMEAARDRKDYVTMERICAEAVRGGYRIEYMVRSWSWSLCRLGRTDEGLVVALRNYEWNPCVWSALNCLEAAADDGQFATARKAARTLLADRASWGELASAVQSAVARVSSKTYRLVWEVPVTRLRAGESLWLPKPLDTWNQKRVAWSATGVVDLQERTDRYGNTFAVAKARGGEPVRVSTEVKLTPFSARELLARRGATDSGAPGASFLGASKSPIQTSTIDPDAPEVLAVTGTFGGATGIRAIEAMMDWVNSELTYCPPGSPPGADNPSEVIRRKGGHCEALTSVEVALLRACKVPARMIRGQSAVSAGSHLSTQHTIVQFQVPGLGWVDWDHNLPRWRSLDSFVRLWVYSAIAEPGDVGHLADFFGRAFQARKGYQHTLIGTSLD